MKKAINLSFKVSLFLFILLSGCCRSECPTITIQGLVMTNQKWQFKTNEPLILNFDIVITSTKSKKKRLCLTYTKEFCLGSIKDAIMDSTIVFCNKPLTKSGKTYVPNSNLFWNKDLQQSASTPDGLLNSEGKYTLDLSQFSFSANDLTTPFVFTLLKRTSKQTLSDTSIITIIP